MGGSREQIYLIITFCWFHRHCRYIILICFVYNVQALNDTSTVSVIITNSINCSFAHLRKLIAISCVLCFFFKNMDREEVQKSQEHNSKKCKTG